MNLFGVNRRNLSELAKMRTRQHGKFAPETKGRTVPTATAATASGPRGPVSPAKQNVAPSEILSAYDRFSSARPTGPTGPTGPRSPQAPQGYAPVQRPQGPTGPRSVTPNENFGTTLNPDFSIQQDRVQHANSLSANPETLADIYQTYDDVPTLAALASNKNAPTHILDDLGRRNINDAVNKKLAMNKSTPVRILHTLVSKHRDGSDVNGYARTTLKTLHREGRIRPNDLAKLQDDGILPRKQ